MPQVLLDSKACATFGHLISAAIFGLAVGGYFSGVIIDLTRTYRMAVLIGVLWNAFNLATVGCLLWRRQEPAAEVREVPRTRKSLSGNVTMTDEIDASLKPLSLKSRIAQRGVVLAPGVYDALTAALAASAGFEALYLSGAAIAYTRLGRPDIGLVSSSEVADALTHVCERVETPIIVDADTGYGNALNVERTVQAVRAGGSGRDPARGPDVPQALRPSRGQERRARA